MSRTLRRRSVRDDEVRRAGEEAGEALSWIPAEEIVAASGRGGRMVNRLTLELRGGARRKLLWANVDPADVPLRAALSEWDVPTRWR